MNKVATASIINEGGLPALLECRRDADAFRWYEADSGADTEVSGPTLSEAIKAARAAWRMWDFRLSS